ncbi:hypothetical protein HL653_03645 [Sphingomonas sp. AP4-R1]|uniref:hypothetical protein n=1 Tax=Sphingomonas sp. AP4-R1 TaxID=2735134 RepID=UPI0014939BBA|nr:hypothetical protein [Sphingomonas sp. AP4-R1]QJU57000.1 hypothetical protein HL653_03645 [Sphingomonas sp. AP4-R1]
MTWLIAGSLLISSCATVRTTPRAADELASGVTYYLPKREIKVTAERKLLKKDDLQKAVTAKKTELETINTLIKTTDSTIKTAGDRLKAASVQGNADAVAAINKELAIATADLDIAKIKKASVEAEINIAEASIRILEAAPKDSCAFSYSAAIELLTPVADTRLRLVADAFHSPLRDDDTKLAINSSGLLSTANVVAADRTGDIIVEIASAFAGVGSGGTAGPLALVGGEPKFAGKPECEKLPTKFAYRLDPALGDQLSKLNNEFYTAGFPFRLDVPPMPDGSTYAVKDKDPTIRDRQRTTGKPKTGDEYTYPIDNALYHKGMNGALFYRTALPQTIVLRQCNNGTACTSIKDTVPIDATMTMLPQVGPISYIPMQSSIFVKTVDDVVFDNGMLVSWNATRPSEVLEVVRLPVKILKAVVSVPAELIKLRIDLSDQQKGLAASQEAQIGAQAKLAKIQACVDATGGDKEKALACFKTE